MSFPRPIGILAVLFSVLPSCSSTKDGPNDPLATVAGFCAAWASDACNATVVDACAAPSRETCVEAQTQYCETLLKGKGYSSTHAEACLSAVTAAYADARLTAAELAVVHQLAKPCDELIAGPGGASAECVRDSDCNTLQGLHCLSKSGFSSCNKPELRTGGQTCDLPAQVCSAGFYCEGRYCVESAAQNKPCSASIPCLPDLQCSGAAGAQTCTPKAGIGATCLTGEDCKSGICLQGASENAVCDDAVILRVGDPLCESLR